MICEAFADLVNVSDDTAYDATDAASCLQYLLLVFGRVRARDLALKYNANLYRGKNQTSLRSQLAAHTTEDKKKKKKKKKSGKKAVEKKGVEEAVEKKGVEEAERIQHDELVECLDEINEEVECSKKQCTDIDK